MKVGAERGNLYLMQGRSLIKVGVTHDVEERRAGHGGEVDGYLSVMRSWHFGADAAAIEGVCKDLLWPHRAPYGCEWFKVSPRRAEKAVRRAARIVRTEDWRRFRRERKKLRQAYQRQLRAEWAAWARLIEFGYDPNSQTPWNDLYNHLKGTVTALRDKGKRKRKPSK